MGCFKNIIFSFSVWITLSLSLINPVLSAPATVAHPIHHVTHKLPHKKIKHHHAHLSKEHHPKAIASYSVPAYFNKSVPTPEIAATDNSGFIASTEKKLVNFVRDTVAHLRYSHYKLGGHNFDSAHGIYVLDCSNFVDNILREASPHAYSSLVNAERAETPSTLHYYDFFSSLTEDPNNFWNKINSVEDLHPGDILVFRNKHYHGLYAGGHVMVVMETPTRSTDFFFVRVADSAPTRHSQDTRQAHKSGIGIGTLLLKVNPLTGHPNAYAWGLGGYWNKNVNFAMARPLDIQSATQI
jgi:hypothetical protein